MNLPQPAPLPLRIDRVTPGERAMLWTLLQEYLEVLARFVTLPKRDEGGYAYRTFDDYFANNGRRFAFFARLDEDVVGFLLLHHADADTSPLRRDAVSVAELYVRPDRQGRGIGRALVEWSADQARSRRLPLHWWVLQRNADARRFYERVAPSAAARIGYRVQRRCARTGDILWTLLPPKQGRP